MKKRLRVGRRGFMTTAVGAAAFAWFRPQNEGGDYTPYFSSLNKELQGQGISHPRLLLDLDSMDHNIDTIQRSIMGAGAVSRTWRIVVKSLPSLELLEYVMRRANTNSLMGFHQPFLNQVAERMPHADILLGKPLPVAALRAFYKQLSSASTFNPESQIQWLIDSEHRLEQYQTFAQQTGVRLNVSLELDIGLRRGGFPSSDQLMPVLKRIQDDPEHLQLGGFMGYEAFLAKLPGKQQRFQRVVNTYKGLVAEGRSQYPSLFESDLTYNIAGSQTYVMYHDEPFFNDISSGSGVVMPTDFDMPSLKNHKPAAYIATPVLKKYDNVYLPGAEWASNVFAALNPNRQQAFYTYGGNWMAEYENPPGLISNKIWGRSSNQEMVNASARVKLSVDDFIFLRPKQSETVFLQFGDLLPMRKGRLQQAWRILEG